MVGAKANRQKASAPFGSKDLKNFVCIDRTLYFFETVKSHGKKINLDTTTLFAFAVVSLRGLTKNATHFCLWFHMADRIVFYFVYGPCSLSQRQKSTTCFDKLQGEGRQRQRRQSYSNTFFNKVN
jgi:hypothetical protein